MSGTIDLIDGDAVLMGEGVVAIRQTSEYGPQSIVLTVEDLRKLIELATS